MNRMTRLSGRHCTGSHTGVPLWMTALLVGLLAFCSGESAAAQDWFRTGTGLGVSKARVAVADWSPKSPTSQPLSALFTNVVRADLDYSGILELVSNSFYPLQAPSAPAELNFKAWADPPASARLLAFGNLLASEN